jgi:chromosome segregation ATPase
MELEARDVRIGELTDEVERLRGAYKVEKTRRSEAQQERGNAQCAVCVAEAEVARLTARVGEADSKLVSLQADHARVVSELSGAKRERDRHRDEADEYYALFCRTLALPFETKSLERAAAAMAALAADQAVIDVARAESARQERDRLLGLVRAQRPRCPREAAWATAVLSEEGASSDGD